jgi:hypothetical protein
MGATDQAIQIVCPKPNAVCSVGVYHLSIQSIVPSTLIPNQFLGVYLDNGLVASNGTSTSFPSTVMVNVSLPTGKAVQNGQFVLPDFRVPTPVANSPMEDGFPYFVLVPGATNNLVITVTVPSSCNCFSGYYFGLYLYGYTAKSAACPLCSPTLLAQASYQKLSFSVVNSGA